MSRLAGLFKRPPGVRIGEPAPPFTLPDQDGRVRTLPDYAGQWLVLYFYPKDDTPGCTAEACSFRDDSSRLQELGAQVLGVSVDSAASHARFADKYGLPFPLLVDEGGHVARRYGSLLRIGPLRLARRHSFIIDPRGRLAGIYRKVHPPSHSDTVIAAIRSLQNQQRG